MTEQEWLVCEDPRAMYAEMMNLTPSRSDRKWRLLACAIQSCYSDRMLPTYDLASRTEVAQIIQKATIWAETGEKPSINSNGYYVLNELAYRGVGGIIEPPYVASDTKNVEMDRKFADLFREVIGNPFQAVDLPKKKVICDWCNGSKKLRLTRRRAANLQMECMRCDGRGWHNTQKDDVSIHAKEIAQQIYATQDYAGMPILADAMEEAGCDEQSILEHLRGNGTHVRGCWALDLILGKE